MKPKILKISGLTFTLLIAIIASLVIEFDQLELIGNPAYYSEGYSDQDENGNSNVQIEKEAPLTFNYQIKSGLKFPYAGVYFEDTLENRKINLANYDQVEIEISASKGKLIPITIHTLWNLKSRPFQQIVETKPTITQYHFELSDFKTPEWWRTKYKVGVDENQKFQEVLTINIEDAHEIPKEEIDQIKVKSIVFSKNNTSIIIVLLTIWLVGILVFILIPFFKPEKKLVPIKAAEFKTLKDENKFEKITVFIGEFYADPELNVRKVSKSTGLKETEVSKLLQVQFSMNFKEYLNFVRITEAKRLLKNSDLQISEIAYTVGYNNVTHFNRVFKATEQISPNEFRS